MRPGVGGFAGHAAAARQQAAGGGLVGDDLSQRIRAARGAQRGREAAGGEADLAGSGKDARAVDDVEEPGKRLADDAEALAGGPSRRPRRAAPRARRLADNGFRLAEEY